MQRYGVALSLEQYVQLCDRVWAFIHTGIETKGVSRAGGVKKAIFFVWYMRTPMLVGWHEGTCQISTFLSRSDRIADREKIIRVRGTPIRLRWKIAREERRAELTPHA